MVRFASRWPEYLETVLSVQRGRVDRDVEQDVVLKWILDLGAKFYLATQTLGLSETLVIDEGFAQRSVAVFAHGWRSDEISELGRYLLSMPVPDLVLFVDAPLEVCRERLDRSGWPARAAAMGAGERRAYLQAASDVVHAAVGELESVGVPVERIDGAAPVDSTRVQAKRSLSI